jgi:hypothetical protein
MYHQMPAFAKKIGTQHTNLTRIPCRPDRMPKPKPISKFGPYVLGFFLAGLLLPPPGAAAKDISDNEQFFHLVSPGESLNKIANRYLPLTEAITIGELIGKIRTLNSIQESLIYPNQRLLIPVARSAPVAAKTVPKARDFKARGIYLNRFSMACRKMDRLLDKLILHGGNAVILDIKDISGRLPYPSRVDLANEIGANTRPTIRDPSRLFHYLHKKGLHTIVRLVLFYDPLLASRRPELALRSGNTGEPYREKGRIAWVDPHHPAVQMYNLDIAKELATMGVDEIQFDYIRFPTVGNTPQTNFSLEKNDIPRYQAVTDFLTQARKQLSPYKVLLSIDVFGVAGWDRPEDVQITGQKIEELVRYCDVVSPMIYPSHFYAPFQGIANPGAEPFRLVSETCKRFSRLLRDSEVTLRPWIQAFPWGVEDFGERYIVEQLRALDQSTSRGWLLWSAGNAYDVAWKALEVWNKRTLNPITASIQRIEIN